MTLLEMKSATITKKGQIALPKQIRKKAFREGSRIAILAFTDRIELRPLKALNESLLTALASENVLAKDWLSKEDEAAWKDL